MKKNNIIEAATYFFATQGFDGTTTKAISDQAGVTEPLLYYHFSGKDEIYTTILEAARMMERSSRQVCVAPN